MAAKQPTKAWLQQQLDELESRLAETLRERDQLVESVQRLKADFDNFRKRTLRDQETLAAQGARRLVKELLPVLDDLDRAAAGTEAVAGECASLARGVALVREELHAVLRREGLEDVETTGQLDPHVHEALLAQPSEADEGTVIDVLQKGYRIGGDVIRPARVVVAAASAAEKAADGNGGH
jgi:molecular chaperone GrpE